jgi:hypothetical protein
MNKKTTNKSAIVLATLLILAMVMQVPPIESVNATVPAQNTWTGHSAMAHWDIIDTDHDNASITIDAFYAQQTSDGKSDMINITVQHPQGRSEAIGYTVNMTSGPTWSMNHVFMNVSLMFNWSTGYAAHPIAMEWFTSPPSVSNSIILQDGNSSYLPGEWRSGTGNLANATMVIGGTGPHPDTYNSTWAAVGQTPTTPALSWSGQGAMAHWDIIDAAFSNIPISIDVMYGQQSTGGSNMVYIRVIHPQGTSEASGYTVNITSGPVWSMDHVFLNTTLTFNWTSGYSAHPIAIDWKTSPPTTSNSITWQNGTTGYLPGDWRSGTGKYANATMVIGGTGPHPGNYSSDWAAVGQTPTVPSLAWTGQGAMAHWNIIDAAYNNTPITIEAVYGQQMLDGSGSNMVYIKVIHPQGTSTATGYTVNITSGPTFSMNHVFLNVTLKFNWTGSYQAHPIAIDWLTSGPTINNSITWQNGTIGYLPGDWRSGSGKVANATIVIGGSGPHPGNYSSDWAAVGQTPATPAPTNWTGQGAMAHWDIIDTGHGNVPISIDAVYGQQTIDGKNSSMVYLKVIHPQGISEATGYAVNVTSGPTWSMDRVVLNTTLSFNWTTGYAAHPIYLEWKASGKIVQNNVTWQNGVTTCVPGEWRSGNGKVANATLIIGGSGPHPANYTSDWAAVGHTPTIPGPSWTGQSAMAHWDVVDTSYNNAMISIDAFYGQLPTADSSKTDMVWVRVIHPQGVSEVTGYAVNITSGPTWSMDQVVLNTTLSFNWTTGYAAHPLYIKWVTSGQTQSNLINWQNGTSSTVTGDWRSGFGKIANATMVIGGSGPHPLNYTSTWAAVGMIPTPTSPTPTPTQTIVAPTVTPTPTPTETPAPTATANTTTVQVTNLNGETIDLEISGNITSTQMTNVAITSNDTSSTVTLSFKVAGETGTVGFGNITIPKSSVAYGTTPVLYIDGAVTADSGFSEDSANFYVWYTVHFSTHDLTIVFNAPPQPTAQPGLPQTTIIAAAAIVAVIVVISAILLTRRARAKR